MADYSNLFRGGGISTTGSSGNKKGKNKIIVFFTLCCAVLVCIWGYLKMTDSSNKIKTSELITETKKKNIDLNINNNKKNSRKNEAKKTLISPKTFRETKEDLVKAEQALNKEEFVDAKKYSTKIMNSGLKEGEEYWEKALAILGKANIGIYMNDIPSSNKKLYTIQEGDSLIRIAKRFKTTVEAIQKSNGLDPSNSIIFPGKTLYIYTGEWVVKISKGKFKLYLYDGNSIFKVYGIGVGKQGRTPSGKFEIKTKQREPIWYNDGKAIPYGSKENVLGTRWMSLKPIGDTNKNLRGYGIHGTWAPETIGTKASNGCIRMKNEEVNELFSILPYRTEVIIED